MNDDTFFERLRNNAQSLRYQADDAMFTRLQARVRDRLQAPATVAQLLAAWFRPVAASIAALTLAAAIGSAWYQNQNVTATATLDSIASPADTNSEDALSVD